MRLYRFAVQIERRSQFSKMSDVNRRFGLNLFTYLSRINFLMPASHQLAAILFTDIVGYTAIMQHDEEQARVIIKRHNSVLEKIVAAHHGEVVNY